jgi:hypothetical protein
MRSVYQSVGKGKYNLWKKQGFFDFSAFLAKSNGRITLHKSLTTPTTKVVGFLGQA